MLEIGTMAGHSQFKNIMHKKGAVDARRSKVFSKLAREITVAAKMGHGVPPRRRDKPTGQLSIGDTAPLSIAAAIRPVSADEDRLGARGS